jgi:hypothetical protein
MYLSLQWTATRAFPGMVHGVSLDSDMRTYRYYYGWPLTAIAVDETYSPTPNWKLWTFQARYWSVFKWRLVADVLLSVSLAWAMALLHERARSTSATSFWRFRWIRFRLASLAFLMAVFGALIAWGTHRHRHVESVANEIKSIRRGAVGFDYVFTAAAPPHTGSSIPRGSKLLRSLLGDHYASDIVSVHLDAPDARPDLGELALRAPRIEFLKVNQRLLFANADKLAEREIQAIRGFQWLIAIQVDEMSVSQREKLTAALPGIEVFPTPRLIAAGEAAARAEK